MYKAWCKQALADHPGYTAVYDGRMRMLGITIIYKIENGKQVMVMSYTMFRLIIEMYNKYASEAVIQGHRFDLGGRLGYIYPARIERHFSSLRCDIVATKRARKTEPNHPAVFFTDSDYCIIKWQKLHQVRNGTVYEFKPAKHTMAHNFYTALRLNPMLKSNYKFCAYKYYTPQQQKSA
jgi:hypothetical protein